MRQSTFVAAFAARGGVRAVLVGFLVGTLLLASCDGRDAELPSDVEFPALAELSKEFDSTLEQIGGTAGALDDLDEWAVAYCWNPFSISISEREGFAPAAKYRGEARARWRGLSPTQIEGVFLAFAKHVSTLGFDATRSGPHAKANVFPTYTDTVFVAELGVHHDVEGFWGGDAHDVYLVARTPCYSLAELDAGTHHLPLGPPQN